jgi:hypothetical protein
MSAACENFFLYIRLVMVTEFDQFRSDVSRSECKSDGTRGWIESADRHGVHRCQ